ncbi:MAG TPA: Gfo/Idh/MocA family oxidoreductase [Bryobacteraceae bacterium]|jgi:predicted dehydrogenase|nr:Gfo/Idh/MocA family oxidoreductase [Bryobacteraceae bacterium]
MLILTVALAMQGAELRVGIIGTDTSHVPVFTQSLNEAGLHVVAAYKGGSQDVASSASRVETFAQQIATKYGVEIVPDIPTLLSKVDVVLLESVDGRVHLEQARPVIAAHKPFFIDKPLAATYEDALEIARLAKAAGVPWFSSSSLRYGEIAAAGKFSDTTGVTAFGPGDLEPHHYLDLSWYAIHTVELLYTLMGPGCESVTRTSTADTDVIVGRWKDGRIGTVRAIRPHSDYGAVVFRGKQIVEIKPQGAGSYKPLVEQIIKFFQTGQTPVPNDETLEIFAFMDAAQKSKEQSGRPVAIQPRR